MTLTEITNVAEALDIRPADLNQYGKWKAKISLDLVHEVVTRTPGKLILVTAMTPTPAGEGKTVTSIGISMALNRLGRNSVVCLRQPSLGPVFGVKGGAAGGGKSTVEPMLDINLRLNGDFDAIGSAHNLLSAMVDNHIFQGNDLGIDVHSISWKRTIDMNDRALRHIVIGLGGKNDGTPREDGFVIAAASEVMAILCISRDYADLKRRLGNIIVGYTKAGSHTVRASDFHAEGSMASLMKYAMEPNLVQTAEGTPALIHGGPFGNVALGTCSLASITFGLNRTEYAVVEAGFATDLGAEKFFDIVSREGGFKVDCAIIVASIRALQYHGSGAHSPGPEASPEEKLRMGLENLAKHIENIRLFGVEPVVAINKFASDSDDELRIVQDFCKNCGVLYAISTSFVEGSAGCLELAERAIEACENSGNNKNRPLYAFEESIQDKIEKIVTQIYGGRNAEFEPTAVRELRNIASLGLSDFPVCMAKTQLSLSDDPKKLGRPRDFTATVRDLVIAAGAGFIIADLGDIIAMPGLPVHPAAEKIDLDKFGTITGVF